MVSPEYLLIWLTPLARLDGSKTPRSSEIGSLHGTGFSRNRSEAEGRVSLPGYPCRYNVFKTVHAPDISPKPAERSRRIDDRESLPFPYAPTDLPLTWPPLWPPGQRYPRRFALASWRWSRPPRGKGVPMMIDPPQRMPTPGRGLWSDDRTLSVPNPKSNSPRVLEFWDSAPSRTRR